MKLLILLLVVILFASEAYAEDIGAFIRNSFAGTKDYSFPVSDCTVEIVSELSRGATRINSAVDDSGRKCLQVGGKGYERGIGVNAPHHLKYTFNKPVKTFSAVIGLDGNTVFSPASAGCIIKADGKEIYRSKIFYAGDGCEKINIPADGACVLELITDDGGDGPVCDHFDYADAKVVFADGSEKYLNEILIPTKIMRKYPFSFEYDGVSSYELLPHWEYAEKTKQIKSDERLNTYIWTSPEGLEVKAEVKLYNNENTADWIVYFTNKGTADTKQISRLRSFDFEVETGVTAVSYDTANGILFKPVVSDGSDRDVVVYNLEGTRPYRGVTMDEFKLRSRYLQRNKPYTVNHRGSGSTDGDDSPYFAVSWPHGGVIGAIGWSGTWGDEFALNGNTLTIEAGTGEHLNTYLKPGEMIRSPRQLITFYEGDNIEKGFNLYRQALIKHILPKVKGKPAFIPAAFTVSATEMSRGNENIDRAYIEASKGLGFEITWIDAYIQQGGYPACLGINHDPLSDIIDKERYPHGVEPLSELAKKYGMDMMMWFTPECVGENNPIRQTHPEYVMDREGTYDNYAIVNSEAREYMVRIMTEAFNKWNIKIFKNDHNTGEDAVIKYMGETAENRLGYAENIMCQSLYLFWDELRAGVPELYMDNCGGGSTRLDLELGSRSLAIGRSDVNCNGAIFTDAVTQARLNQCTNMNLNYMMPWTTGFQCGSTPYEIRSGFNTGLSYVGNLLQMTDAEKQDLKKGIAEGKRLRKYALGDFYVLFAQETESDSWCAWQYHRAKENDGCILAFRRENSCFSGLAVHPRSIDKKAVYSVEFYESYELKETRRLKGEELAELKINIDSQPGSLLIEYKKL